MYIYIRKKIKKIISLVVSFSFSFFYFIRHLFDFLIRRIRSAQPQSFLRCKFSFLFLAGFVEADISARLCTPLCRRLDDESILI